MDSCVASLSLRLELGLRNLPSPGKINSKTRTIPPGILGYVSFISHRNPKEENIEVLLSLFPEENKAKMTAEIYWSDGEEFISYGQHEIIYSSLTDLTQETRKVYSQLEEEIYQKMFELIKSDI